MSELEKLIKRARYCRNSGEPFIWDNSWLNECSAELTQLCAERDERHETHVIADKEIDAAILAKFLEEKK